MRRIVGFCRGFQGYCRGVEHRHGLFSQLRVATKSIRAVAFRAAGRIVYCSVTPIRGSDGAEIERELSEAAIARTTAFHRLRTPGARSLLDPEQV